MSRQTTRAATHAWWVTSRPELNDLAPLQLILGQARLAAGAEEPTPQQAAMLAEPWNKRYARLLDAQSCPIPLTEAEICNQDARCAIDGAIAYGRMGVNPPPADHWLTEYWSIGQQLAELGKTSAWDNVTPIENRQKEADSPAGNGDGMANGWPQDQRDIEAREALKSVPSEPTDEWCRRLGDRSYGSGFVGDKTRMKFCANVIRDVLATAPVLARPAPEALGAAGVWVSVGDEMPHKLRTVLASYTNCSGKQRIIRAKYVAAKTVEANTDADDCACEYDEETDTYWLQSGWYEQIDNWGDYSSVAVCEGDVTHWMHLPSAPATTTEQS